MNGAVGFDAKRARQLRRIVYRYAHQIVDAEFLRWQIILARIGHLREHQKKNKHLVLLQQFGDPFHCHLQFRKLLIDTRLGLYRAQ